MSRLTRIPAALWCLATLVAAGCAGAGPPPISASTARDQMSRFVPAGPGWRYADGVLYHVPRYAASRSREPHIKPLYFQVPYLGGVVISAPKFYFTFWGYKKGGDPNKVEPLLEEYAKSMGGSGHNNIETQYYEGSTGTRTYITNPAKQYGGAWNDDAAIPKTPTDPEIAAQALKAVAHFGYDPNGVYVVATAHNHGEVGFGTNWCSYHSNTYYKKTNVVPYSYLPYIPDAGKSCDANVIKPPSDESADDEGVTIYGGHEFGEVITDPLVSTAWDGPEGEIADQCTFDPMANEPFGTKSFTMQPMASDADNACVQSDP